MQRPTTVTVFGVLNIIFGASSALCTPFSLLPLLSSGDPSAEPLRGLMAENTFVRIWMLGSGGLSWVMAVVLLVSGIGLLQLRSWGRALSLGYGIVSLIIAVIWIPVNWIYMLRPLLEAISSHTGPAASEGMRVALAGGAGMCLGPVYPILLLIFMKRPNVVAALNPPAAPVVGETIAPTLPPAA